MKRMTAFGSSGMVAAVGVAAVIGVSLWGGTWIARSTAAGDSVDPVLLAAGDIARCDAEDDEAVARLLDEEQGTVVALGDQVYPSGTTRRYAECYAPSWGHHRARTRPTPGNHDYRRSGAGGYFGYFGSLAGPGELGYYSYAVGVHWQAISLNSNCEHIPDGCGPESAQMRWLQDELGRHAGKNIVAYWHHAVFSSGHHGGDQRARGFWRLLHEAGADLVLVSHDHNYERFAELDADGDPQEGGLRQFVVGTGGGQLRAFPGEAETGTEMRDAESHGVLKVELHPTSYSWEYLPAEGSTFTDSGTSPVR